MVIAPRNQILADRFGACIVVATDYVTGIGIGSRTTKLAAVRRAEVVYTAEASTRCDSVVRDRALRDSFYGTPALTDY